ncbi:hypothetical protein AVEN_237837-1 [Araneus ventricosus]|uniref:Uncharacterized protein n=1 Tax=Araneus ventricosus TaxID=182803 RepID=A0A4Y2LBI9_ARAVE|nr:hypothetical protein AVEN_237837-1 [Araneus ventricosus]
MSRCLHTSSPGRIFRNLEICPFGVQPHSIRIFHSKNLSILLLPFSTPSADNWALHLKFSVDEDIHLCQGNRRPSYDTKAVDSIHPGEMESENSN